MVKKNLKRILIIIFILFVVLQNYCFADLIIDNGNWIINNNLNNNNNRINLYNIGKYFTWSCVAVAFIIFIICIIVIIILNKNDKKLSKNHKEEEKDDN